jgi:hypothetical protein
MVRPDEDAFFLQVRDLSAQAALAEGELRWTEAGVSKVRYRRRAIKRAAAKVNAVATS